MIVIPLPTATVIGDVWKQLVELARPDDTFAGLTATAEVFSRKNGKLTELPFAPTVVATSVPGLASCWVTIDPAHTNQMAAGDYSVRLRVTTDTWGPYSVVQLDFSTLA